MKVVDLFSGVGGLSHGFMKLGCDIVLANEIDKNIANAYSRNHPDTKMINEDITSIKIPLVFGDYKNKIDIVVGGPPCQGFSQKGSRKSINDERNYLFRYYFKVVDYLKPKYFLMENVPNLLTTENGHFIDEIKELFVRIGYNIKYDVLNAADFGVPQNRKRAFIIGKLKVQAPDLPIGNANLVSVKEAIGDLEFLISGEGCEEQEYRSEPLTDYQRKMRANSQKLYNHKATRHSIDSLNKLAMIPKGMGKEVLPTEMLTKSVYSGTWSRMIEDQPTITITTRFDTPSSGRFTHYELDRCITVREAARIQSFPDDFIFYGPKSSQMKQVGNAVPPLVSEAIATVIINDACN